MDPFFEQQLAEDMRRERRAQRLEKMKQQKLRQQRFRKKMKELMPIGLGVACAVLMIYGFHDDTKNKTDVSTQESQTIDDPQVALESNITESATNTSLQGSNDVEIMVGEKAEVVNESVLAADEIDMAGQGLIASAIPMENPFDYKVTQETKVIDEAEIISNYAVLIDASTDEIIAMKSPKERMNPASMTKIMTVLVAAEHVTDLDDTFTITLEMTDYAYVNDCSSAGFLDGETVTVRDLFYGTILPSGGEAALALATYVAGSHEAFVEMMNEKLEELGLADTAHFTNCVGLYDKEHYCTTYDMAVIIDAAINNELCKEVMSARTYTTSMTTQHPEGITISNWFLRRIEDKETGGEVVSAKTGYVNQSGSCAASYFTAEDGTPYICVTAKSSSSWNCIYDQVALYSKYAVGHDMVGQATEEIAEVSSSVEEQTSVVE